MHVFDKSMRFALKQRRYGKTENPKLSQVTTGIFQKTDSLGEQEHYLFLAAPNL
jgi:hypothetical protein